MHNCIHKGAMHNYVAKRQSITHVYNKQTNPLSQVLPVSHPCPTHGVPFPASLTSGMIFRPSPAQSPVQRSGCPVVYHYLHQTIRSQDCVTRSRLHAFSIINQPTQLPSCQVASLPSSLVPKLTNKKMMRRKDQHQRAFTILNLFGLLQEGHPTTTVRPILSHRGSGSQTASSIQFIHTCHIDSIPTCPHSHIPSLSPKKKGMGMVLST